ncbi:hypothetical protein SDC9_32312 [bioreactor metagenome]|uniref:Uncharacterized protein n=1 Tax=bioreactor metagenome TaxID=1076179 RepID=A0A644V6A0_9ZZZZ|nr:hypothetical protein [Macellibacteroides fermentans]
MQVALRLEFKNVFPNENKKDILDYLKEISKDTLFKLIGFSTRYPQPNFDNFFSNPELGADIYNRVLRYCINNKISTKPVVISREASLRISEIILSHIDEFKSAKEDVDRSELNIFKSFLIINEELNAKDDKKISSDENLEKFVDMSISSSFPLADLGLYGKNDIDFYKLLYCTLVRFNYLLEFLKSKDEYKYLEEALCTAFATSNPQDLLYQVKYLFGNLLVMKGSGSYIFAVEDKNQILFLDSFVSEVIDEDDDFTHLRNFPLLKTEDNVYTIIDFFFTLDKFTKSAKFILKDAFNKKHGLPPEDRTFFSFYNKEFSEDFLMKKVLDELFPDSLYIKKKETEDHDNEPDYYARNKDRVYFFENKDVMIAKGVKSSGDIEKINEALQTKFNKGKIGIGQLIYSIKQIVNKTFKFDDGANKRNDLVIYPILLVSDRIFMCQGINHRINTWFRAKLGNEYTINPLVKDLTVIDIDTIIYWLPYLKQNHKNFRNIIHNHTNVMTDAFKTKPKRKYVDLMEFLQRKIEKQLRPISERLRRVRLEPKYLLSLFKDIFPEK